MVRRSPAGARRPGSPQPRRFTGRATVLALVLGALLLAYAYPVRIYLNQQAEIDALRAHQRAQRDHIEDLRTESAKWNDPAYVKAQAASRLGMTEPGKQLWFVVGGDTNATTDPGTGQAKDTGSWYGQLWTSLVAADQPGKGK
jgi:cell division protein FtsB